MKRPRSQSPDQASWTRKKLGGGAGKLAICLERWSDLEEAARQVRADAFGSGA
jgi:hypothetical protein